jgi:hypothetical protein
MSLETSVIDMNAALFAVSIAPKNSASEECTPFMMSWRVEPVSVNEEILAWLAIQREVAMQWHPD